MIGLQVVIHLKPPNNMRRHPRADGSMRVLHGVAQLHFFAVLEERLRIRHDLGVERIWHLVARLIHRIGQISTFIHAHQHWVQVQIIQMVGATADLSQQISAANHLFQITRPDLSHDLADFGGEEGEEIDDLVRRSGEFLTQARGLNADADRAGIGLTLTDHDAAHRDQRRSTNAVFLGAHHRCDDNIAARSEATVSPQSHAVTQLVHGETLMPLSQAHFPRQTGVFN